MDLVRTTPDPLIEAVDESLRPTVELNGVELRVESMLVEERVRADARKIERMLLNLISNAIEFPPKGRRASITAVRDSSNLLTTVADTGIGGPPDEPAQIFERFPRDLTPLTRSSPVPALALRSQWRS